MSDRIKSLAFQVWRDHITTMIDTANFQCIGNNNQNILGIIKAKVAHFEDELPKLKEITTILELALWKLRMLRMNENITPVEVTHRKKKIKTDESSIRQQCRVTCGADIVIWHILPYLITATDEESDSESDSESDANDVDDNESSDSE